MATILTQGHHPSLLNCHIHRSFDDDLLAPKALHTLLIRSDVPLALCDRGAIPKALAGIHFLDVDRPLAHAYGPLLQISRPGSLRF